MFGLTYLSLTASLEPHQRESSTRAVKGSRHFHRFESRGPAVSGTCWVRVAVGACLVRGVSWRVGWCGRTPTSVKGAPPCCTLAGGRRRFLGAASRAGPRPGRPGRGANRLHKRPSSFRCPPLLPNRSLAAVYQTLAKGKKGKARNELGRRNTAQRAIIQDKFTPW